MKRLSYLILLTLVLVSCGTKSDHFTLEGRLLNLNQGEFYVYSTDGLINDIDTIHVQAGRFSYDIECTTNGTLVIVFPNFSEQPVFAQPGKSCNLEGDASKLKEARVKGTKENKLMNQFREQIESASPDEIRHYAELFVGDHPESLVSIYLVRKYFITCQNSDYKKADKLLKIIQKAQPENGRLKQLIDQVEAQSQTAIGSPLPKFKVVDINGDTITQAKFSKGDAIIYVWATWEYESCNMQRNLKNTVKDKVTCLGICLDADKTEYKKLLDRENIDLPIVFDGKMFDSPLVKKLGFTSIPDNIVVKNGKITGRNLTLQQIREKFN